MKHVLVALAALVATPALAIIPAHYPTAATATITASATVTAAQINSWLGAPDDVHTGIGGQWVQYDLGNFRLINGTGQDLNVYEVDSGAVEFNLIDILVSANGTDFFNIEGTSAAALNLVGDEAHGNAGFRRSYDVGGAVTALGASQFRFVRFEGNGNGALGGSNSFDLEAIGLINFADVTPITPAPGVPEPASWAMMILGFGLVGSSARRRRPAKVTA